MAQFLQSGLTGTTPAFSTRLPRYLTGESSSNQIDNKKRGKTDNNKGKSRHETLEGDNHRKKNYLVLLQRTSTLHRHKQREPKPGALTQDS